MQKLIAFSQGACFQRFVGFSFVGLETNKGLYDWWFREALEGFAMSCFCSIVKPAKSLFVTIARVKQAILLLSFLDDSF